MSVRPKGTVKPPRLTAECRAKALESGLWQRADGEFEPLSRMNDEHLINALLKTLEQADPQAIWEPLCREVVRRRLVTRCKKVAAERQKSRRK